MDVSFLSKHGHYEIDLSWEIVYVRTCNKGDIKTSFLAINNPDRADANCPHDGRASRISGGLVDSYIY
jgi:hypothetical protein